MSTALPRIDVVILNWNLPHDTNLCVTSVLASDYAPLQVLVVDNGSEPALIQQLDTNHERVDLICTHENLGFAGGCNVGIQAALNAGSDYILLINNDTTIAPDMISKLYAALQADSSLGMVGPMIFYADQPDQVWFSGERFWRKLYVVRRGLRFTPTNQACEEVDFVSGCGMLVPRKIWQEVGLLDARYFMYYEDLDFSVRVKNHGYRLACVPHAHMWHAVSASSGGTDSPLKQRLQLRSTLLFYRQHTHGLWFILNLLIRFAHMGWTFLRNLGQRRLSLASLRAAAAGLFDALRSSR